MPTVFISYSHKDEDWKERLQKQLAVLKTQGLLSVWEDRQIQEGDAWYPKIEEALNEADVAILLISADFLTSNFICREEVPRLLKRREQEGIRVIPLILKPCAWRQVKWLNALQGASRDNVELSGLSEHEQDQELCRLAERVNKLLHGDEGQPKPPGQRRQVEKHENNGNRRRPVWVVSILVSLLLLLPTIICFYSFPECLCCSQGDCLGTTRIAGDPIHPPMREISATATQTAPFHMGSPDTEPGHAIDEARHDIWFKNDFAISESEITNAEWKVCIASGACSPPPPSRANDNPNFPVVNVTWGEADAYTKWLSAKTGLPYRLPTEAEWEYAARAGTYTAYFYGPDIDESQANFDNHIGHPVAVCSYPPNGFCLCDMHGNVAEWVQDAYDSVLGSPPDGSAKPATEGGTGLRVVRGGDWSSPTHLVRSASRGRQSFVIRSPKIGFRVAYYIYGKSASVDQPRPH